MRGYPQFSFWISITLVKICFSRIFRKPRKNTFELVGTVIKFDVWINPVKFTIWVDPNSDLSSVHEKSDVLTGPSLVSFGWRAHSVIWKAEINNYHYFYDRYRIKNTINTYSCKKKKKSHSLLVKIP